MILLQVYVGGWVACPAFPDDDSAGSGYFAGVDPWGFVSVTVDIDLGGAAWKILGFQIIGDISSAPNIADHIGDGLVRVMLLPFF